ncbi:MAG: apolipoprotein N-acyltransferase [Hydrogenothermaceae bacterium]
MTKKGIFLSVLSGLFLGISLPNFFIPFGFLIGFYILFKFIVDYPLKKVIFYSFITGLTFSVISFYWIIYAVSYYGGINLFLSSILFILFTFSYSAWVFISFSVIVKLLYNRYGLNAIFTAPFVWVFLEFSREFFPFNGFPWNLVGYMLSYINPIAQITAFFSVYGLSFLVLLLSVVFFLMFRVKEKKLIILAILTILIFIIIFIYGQFRIDNYRDSGKSVKVAVIQANIDESLKLNPTQETNIKIIDIYTDLIKQSLKDNPDFVVLPESAIPIYPYIDTPLRDYFFHKIKDINVPIITGFDNVLLTPNMDIDKIYNSVFILDENHTYVDYYNKIKLVPFGEYAPFKNKILENIFTYLQGIDFTKGKEQKILTYRDLKVVPLICFESIFPDFVSDFVNKGGNVIVNVTNDGWFGKTSAPYQHFEMARIRSIETGRYLIRAANTGISAVINPVGVIKGYLPLKEEGFIVQTVYLYDEKTFFTAYKTYIYFIFILIFLSLITYFELKYRKEKVEVKSDR